MNNIKRPQKNQGDDSYHILAVCRSPLRPCHAPWLFVPLGSALSQEVGQTLKQAETCPAFSPGLQ